jgi:hypothetical protein
MRAGSRTKSVSFCYPIERTFYVGIGLNLNEILFGAGHSRTSQSPRTPFRWAVQKTLEYIQVPYTAAYGSTNSREAGSAGTLAAMLEERDCHGCICVRR